jgi:hypothetical protein
LPRQRRESTAGKLTPHSLDVGLHQLHQLPDGIALKGEPGTGGPIDLRKSVNRTESQGSAVAGDRAAGIVQAVAPDLQRANLGNAVLDVVERLH